MESIASRLKIYLLYREMSTSEFSRLLEYKSCEKIARLFRTEGAKPSVNIVADIATRFKDLSIHWLLTGEGDMIKKYAYLSSRPENAYRLEALEELYVQSRMEEPVEMTV